MYLLLSVHESHQTQCETNTGIKVDLVSTVYNLESIKSVFLAGTLDKGLNLKH